MSRSVVVRLFLVGFLITALFTGCSRDPNIRKQKFLESGDRYFDKGKYREAAIQYANALQVDSRFAQAHYKLGETYLKLGDGSRAVQELSRAVDLAPDNYRRPYRPGQSLGRRPREIGMDLSNDEYLKQARVELDLLREKQPQNPAVFQAWADYYAVQNNIRRGAAGDAESHCRRSQPLGVLLESGVPATPFQPRPTKPKLISRKPPTLTRKAMNAQLALGGFYQSRNRMPEAEQQFKHAIELAPKDPAPREALVRLYMAEGKKTEAEGATETG